LTISTLAEFGQKIHHLSKYDYSKTSSTINFSRENWSGGNDGLMESEENIQPFPSLPTGPWKSLKNSDYHIPTARRLLLELDNSTLEPLRQINFAATESISAG
jgi:hypothetical protein